MEVFEKWKKGENYDLEKMDQKNEHLVESLSDISIEIKLQGTLKREIKAQNNSTN